MERAARFDVKFTEHCTAGMLAVKAICCRVSGEKTIGSKSGRVSREKVLKERVDIAASVSYLSAVSSKESLF